MSKTYRLDNLANQVLLHRIIHVRWAIELTIEGIRDVVEHFAAHDESRYHVVGPFHPDGTEYRFPVATISAEVMELRKAEQELYLSFDTSRYGFMI